MVNFRKSLEVSDLNWGKEIQSPARKTLPSVGRNDPCICGSGKKYKKCCLQKMN